MTLTNLRRIFSRGNLWGSTSRGYLRLPVRLMWFLALSWRVLCVPQTAGKILFCVACVCNFVCRVQKNGCSNCRETFRIYGRCLWDDANKFGPYRGTLCRALIVCWQFYGKTSRSFQHRWETVWNNGLKSAGIMPLN